MALMNIRKRWLLVVLISSTQLALMLVGVMYASDWIRKEMSRLDREHIIVNNAALVELQVAKIDAMNLQDWSEGSSDWNQLQTFVENTKLPKNGLLCIVELESGNVVLGQFPGQPATIKDVVFQGQKGKPSIYDCVQCATGWRDFDSVPYIVSAKKLNGSNLALISSQNGQSNAQAVANIVYVLRSLGFALTLLIGLVSTSLIVVVLQRFKKRFDSHSMQLCWKSNRAA